jgi:protein-disulfide isomerase
MRKLITASLAVTALVAALSNIAAADPAAPAVTPVAQATYDHNVAGISQIVVSPATPADESGINRIFQPNDSKALTVGQMTAAWNAEIERVFETPVTGGG